MVENEMRWNECGMEWDRVSKVAQIIFTFVLRSLNVAVKFTTTWQKIVILQLHPLNN